MFGVESPAAGPGVATLTVKVSPAVALIATSPIQVCRPPPLLLKVELFAATTLP